MVGPQVSRGMVRAKKGRAERKWATGRKRPGDRGSHRRELVRERGPSKRVTELVSGHTIAFVPRGNRHRRERTGVHRQRRDTVNTRKPPQCHQWVHSWESQNSCEYTGPRAKEKFQQCSGTVPIAPPSGGRSTKLPFNYDCWSATNSFSRSCSN